VAGRPPSPEADAGPGRQATPGTPRWVKVFGIIAIVLVVLVILMLTGVLGQGHGPGRHMGGARDDTQPSSGVGAPADADEATRTIQVSSLDTMTFEPTSIDVVAGETVTFAVTNKGKGVHEFSLGDASMQQQHADAMAHIPAGMAHDRPGSITMQSGETKQLTWRFGVTGTLEFACHQSGHYQAGMRGQITIT
jgi:uncharacterized cupredoxin-like copper-binding protein